MAEENVQLGLKGKEPVLPLQDPLHRMTLSDTGCATYVLW